MLSERIIRESRILIIDDESANVELLQRILEWAGYANVIPLCDPTKAFVVAENCKPDIILLDLHMPVMNGFELLQQIREQVTGSKYVPILVFTADINPESKKKALELGANDFLTKPGDATEIMLRVRNFLETRHLHRQLQDQNLDLEQKVQERTQALETARLEALEKLARAAEFRDDDTGEHAKRVGATAVGIAEQLGWAHIDVEELRMAAPLHDIGKIGLPDSILLKPGKLTDEEFEVMKRHTRIGASILGDSESPVLQLAKMIAMAHHEWWDGTGYPGGLGGEEICLAARIVAVADVFDALTHARPYKEAWPEQDAEAEISKCAGSHFDPQVVEAFLAMRQKYGVARAA
ncbi:MAG TPA: HD domain-containing phosphohydrolase [Fimbriimonadaceae bacterium]|jgi:putative two-component system response regulator